ncbi:hypothetical protein Pla52o_15510 [Novipirellula galeiformis]|uniref:Uncharacterized protein n=1 Tax=Novipirellula galeiformis TaxID=2528004 RepID=A0A5C6CK58_9BACT|nr:hypothetical protein Pla52o_15510 [Novipirellula galeiformis]
MFSETKIDFDGVAQQVRSNDVGVRAAYAGEYLTVVSFDQALDHCFRARAIHQEEGGFDVRFDVRD